MEIFAETHIKVHVTLAYIDVPVKLMETHRGWAYGRSVYEQRSEVPLNLPKSEKCPRCFRLVDDGHASD